MVFETFGSPGILSANLMIHLSFLSYCMLMYMHACTYVCTACMYVHSVHIVSSSVTDVQVTAITPENVTNSTYSIAVNCTINSASIADMCEVMATANDQTLTGNEYELV